MTSHRAVCLQCATQSLHKTGYCELCDDFTGLIFASDGRDPVSRRIRTVIFRRIEGDARSGVRQTEYCIGPATFDAIFAVGESQLDASD